MVFSTPTQESIFSGLKKFFESFKPSNKTIASSLKTSIKTFAGGINRYGETNIDSSKEGDLEMKVQSAFRNLVSNFGDLQQDKWNIDIESRKQFVRELGLAFNKRKETIREGGNVTGPILISNLFYYLLKALLKDKPKDMEIPELADFFKVGVKYDLTDVVIFLNEPTDQWEIPRDLLPDDSRKYRGPEGKPKGEVKDGRKGRLK